MRPEIPHTPVNFERNRVRRSLFLLPPRSQSETPIGGVFGDLPTKLNHAALGRLESAILASLPDEAVLDIMEIRRRRAQNTSQGHNVEHEQLQTTLGTEKLGKLIDGLQGDPNLLRLVLEALTDEDWDRYVDSIQRGEILAKSHEAAEAPQDELDRIAKETPEETRAAVERIFQEALDELTQLRSRRPRRDRGPEKNTPSDSA